VINSYVQAVSLNCLFTCSSSCDAISTGKYFLLVCKITAISNYRSSLSFKKQGDIRICELYFIRKLGYSMAKTETTGQFGIPVVLWKATILYSA